MKWLLLLLFGSTVGIGVCLSLLVIIICILIGKLTRKLELYKSIANSLFLHLSFYFPIAILSPFLSISFDFHSSVSPIFICNHQSEWDIFFLIYALKKSGISLSNVFFWIRKEQQQFFFIGKCFQWLDYPCIEFAQGNKANGKSVAMAMKQTKYWLESKQGILLVFPEGLLNSSLNQQLLLPFKNGVFQLIKEVKLTQINLVVMHQTKYVWTQKKLLIWIQSQHCKQENQWEQYKISCWNQMNQQLQHYSKNQYK